MPNRIVREAILTSRHMAMLDDWAAEVFYRRLLSVVDDFGRFYADPGMLRAACYPRQLDKVSDADVTRWISECQKAGLVLVYVAADEDRYIEVLRFRQQARAKSSRFPDPTSTCVASATQTDSTCVADAQHMRGSAPVFVFVDEVVDVCEAHASAREPAASAAAPPSRSRQKRKAEYPKPDAVSAEAWADWLSVRAAKRAGPVTATAWRAVEREAERAGIGVQAAVECCAEAGWQGFNAGWYAQRMGRSPPAKSAASAPEWVTAAGFRSLAEATNEGCTARNAHEYREGVRA